MVRRLFDPLSSGLPLKTTLLYAGLAITLPCVALDEASDAL